MLKFKFKIDPLTDAVFVIDPEPCFMPGGPLPVLGGKELIPVWESLLLMFPFSRRFASRDMHKKGSISLCTSYNDIQPFTLMTKQLLDEYKLAGKRLIKPDSGFSLKDVEKYLERGNYTIWPEHGLLGDPMTELVQPVKDLVGLSHVILKGYDNPATDSYSAFFDGLGNPSRAIRELTNYGVERLVLAGLAEDYCVGYSAIDAQTHGFEVFVVTDAIAAVDPNSEHCKNMRKQMERSGVKFITMADVAE